MMEGFKEYMQLNEAFELPFKVYQDIFDYAFESNKKRREKPRTKIEPRKFNLDLSGTPYEFLNVFHPSIKVEMSPLSQLGSPGVYYHGKLEKHGTGAKFPIITGNMGIAFMDDNIGNLFFVIEHELLHFLQDLIQQYSSIKKIYGFSRTPSYRTKTEIGGLPPMPLVKKIKKDREIDVAGTKNTKRTVHALRPTEYYTNLNSIIKVIQAWYLNNTKNPDLQKAAADVEAKKEYFKNKILSDDNQVKDMLDRIKNLDEDLYKIYLNTIAKRFILNSDFYQDYKKLSVAVEDMKKHKIDLENKKKENSPLAGTRFTEKDFDGKVSIGWYDLGRYSYLYDYNDDEIREMIDTIGVKIKEDEYSEPMSINFKLSYKNLAKIFKKLRNWRDSRKLKSQQCNVDRMARYLAADISGDGYGMSPRRPTAKEILELFYGPPLQDCKISPQGHFTND